MANDWIPLRCDIAEDPATISIGAALGLPEYAVVGLLHRLWSWANRQLSDCNARGVTENWIDRFLTVPGFASAMARTGWIVIHADRVEFVNFERWNSQGAKRRILATNRVARHRATSNAIANADVNASSVTAALPEKRREEKREEEIPPTPQGGDLGESGPEKTPRKRKPKATEGPGPESVPVPPNLDEPQFRDAWAKFIAHRGAMAKSKRLTATAAELALKKLTPFGPVTATELAERAVMNGWMGIVFPDTATAATRSRPQTTPSAAKPSMHDRVRAIHDSLKTDSRSKSCQTTIAPNGSLPGPRITASASEPATISPV